MDYKFIKRDKIDPENPYRPFISGCVEKLLDVGGRQRRIVYYIPDNIKPSTAGIVLVPPGGVGIDEFLEKSGWVQIADGEESKEGLVLLAVESPDGGWDTSEAYGKCGGDADYIHKAILEFNLRSTVCVHEAKRYIVGYNDGAALARMTAAYDPAALAGMVCVDGGDVNAAYLKEAGSDFAVNLYGYEDPEHIKDIKKGEIPLPAWFIESAASACSASAEYFRSACGCAECGHLIDAETVEYTRQSETEYPLNQDSEAYRVWVSNIGGASSDFGIKLNRRIWKRFLYGVRRWMGDPGGDLRLTADPVADLGMEYHYKTIGGYNREWYVYVPESVKAAPCERVPLVFAMHGYSCSGEVYIGNSGWERVADAYGFIVAFPTAIPGFIGGSMPEGGVSPDNVPLPTWNCVGHVDGRPYEIDFFEYMLDSISKDHCIDKSRIYITGHSNGSMITSWLSIARPEMFAAAAPCSGILYIGGTEEALNTPEAKNRKRVDLPIWMTGGERENWLLDAVPDADNRTGKSITAWWSLNDMPGEPPKDYAACMIRNGRWNDWSFDKNRVPMIRFSSIDYFPHATVPEQSFRIWEDFFSRYRRSEDGSVIFEG